MTLLADNVAHFPQEVRRKAVDDRLEARLVEERRLAEEAAQRERSARSVQRKESNGTVGERHGENVRLLGCFIGGYCLFG